MSKQSSVCIYNEFDPVTLAPTNDQTARRIEELGLERLELRGRSVLDIGCNNGLASFLCATSGAVDVHAVDVNPDLVELVKAQAQARGLNCIRAEMTGFDQLDAQRDQADVVLFLEVLHWVVGQGMSIREAMRRLWALTRETLVMEFPWSVSEPSISRQTALTEAEYNSQLILEWLTLCFDRVEFRCFNTYFQGQPGSCRALVVCSRPKVSVFLDDVLPGISRVEREVTPNLWRVAGSGNPVHTVKRVSADAPMRKLPRGLLETFVSEISAGGRLVVPRFIAHGGRFLLDGVKGESSYVAYPWLEGVMAEADSMEALEAAYACALAGISAYEQLEAGKRGSLAEQGLADLHHSVRRVHPDRAGWTGPVTDEFWGVNHGDVHTRNVIRLTGQLQLLDFDNCDVGVRGMDILWSLVLVTEDDPATVSGWVRRWRALAPQVPLEAVQVQLKAHCLGWEENWRRHSQPDLELWARMKLSLGLVLGAVSQLEQAE